MIKVVFFDCQDFEQALWEVNLEAPPRIGDEVSFWVVEQEQTIGRVVSTEWKFNQNKTYVVEVLLEIL